MLLVMVVGNRRGRIDAYYLLAIVISTIYVLISITIDHLIKYYARQPSPKKNRPWQKQTRDWTDTCIRLLYIYIYIYILF